VRQSAAGRAGGPFPDSVRKVWVARGWPGQGARIAVACSGGVDSLTLLHLLRFPLADLGLDLAVAHFDHRMRSSGAAEAQWLAGVAGAWGLPLYRGEAETIPRNETGARAARYRFLRELVESGRVDRILTAHHADDQVETVLFRILRGTGIDGLRGIPERRDPGILRPLLDCSRREIVAYAEQHGLRPRVDPSNLSPRFTRNRIRHELLPLAEAIHPGAGAAILRLSRNARESRELLDALLQERLGRVELGEDDLRVAERRAAEWRGEGGGGEGSSAAESGVALDRARLLAEEESVQRALIRRVARSLGVKLSRTGTATALQFMRGGSSGGALKLPGGIVIEREFDVLRVRRAGGGIRTAAGPGDPPPDAGDLPLLIHRTGAGSTDRAGPVAPGSGLLRVGGRWFEARWAPGKDEGAEWSTTFDPARLAFPLSLRGWMPGDRTHTEGGGRKLKKLFGERRVPVRDRHRWPLLVEEGGEVLWIPGLHRSPRFAPGDEGSSCAIEVRVVDGA